MDSLTQIVLGASLCAAIAPAKNRRAALLAGAALGTLPDLDTFPLMLLTDNPVSLMTLHRGLTHSLLVLPLIGWLVWWICKRRGHRVRQSPQRWFWAIQATLITHPLLDAFTVYGTQLWWPFTPHPAMWSSLFIIDPLYTIWLLLGCLVALAAGARRIAQQALVAGLVLSTCYIGWSLAAKSMADRAARETLAAMGYANAPYFSVPTAFNTFLWRGVALTEDGFLEGERSVLADKGPMQFRHYPSDTVALEAVSNDPDAARLLWFSSGFQKTAVHNKSSQAGQILVLSDLRMGAEPEFYFSFAVAERDVPDAPWQPIEPQRMVNTPRSLWSLSRIWQRIWQEPEIDEQP